MRLAESLSLEPARRMVAAEEGARDRLEALREWNRAGKRPTQVAIHRDLASPLTPSIVAADWTLLGSRAQDGGWLASSPRGALVWGAAVEVANAQALRLRLEKLVLPDGTRLWVHGTADQAYFFDLSHRTPEGSAWSPMVLGDRIHLEIEVPESFRGRPFSLEVAQVSEYLIRPAGAVPALAGPIVAPEDGAEDCLVFGSCYNSTHFSGINDARGYVVQQYFEDGAGFVCSGGLLNDFDAATQKPWMLSAAHCYDGLNLANVESSIDPWYRYVATGCPPTGSTLQQGPIGGDIVVVKPAPDPDVALVLMNSMGLPGGLVLGGWSTLHVGHGQQLHRLSHPVACIPGLPCTGPADEAILPQMYSRHTTDDTPAFDCTGVGIGLNEFIYSVTTLGTTAGGSSGSPIARNDGIIVGQLLGKCQAGNTDDCAYGMFNVLDGRFEAGYEFLEPFLNPTTTGDCVENATTICLNNDRFRVNVLWTDFGGIPHDAFVSAQSTADTGIFYFIGPENLEFMVKVLDACSFSNAYWVFAAGATNVGYVITVTDTERGGTKQYSNPLGNPAPAVTDTSAFATCP